jgi:transposase-like protein
MEGREMKARIPKRTYTAQFREAAVRQLIEAGRTASEVARSLDISSKTLGNWVRGARRGLALVSRAAAVQIDDTQAVKRHEELTPWRRQELTPWVDHSVAVIGVAVAAFCRRPLRRLSRSR